MLVHVPGLLTAEQVTQARAKLSQAPWVDGRVTAGHQSARAKKNKQVPEDHPAARELGETILAALGRNSLFVAAALPKTVFPPLFNKYESDEAFGTHVDNAIRHLPGTPVRIRTDLSATLFLSDPHEYDGGELTVEDVYGFHQVKLPAGDLVLYPASSLHHVKPVTRGARVASFFWIQSMIRDEAARTMLFELDNAIQSLRKQLGDSEEVVSLTGLYHNLVRRWADA